MIIFLMALFTNEVPEPFLVLCGLEIPCEAFMLGTLIIIFQ